MVEPVRRDWCEEHNRGSLVATDGLCPECEERFVKWKKDHGVVFDQYVARINSLAEEDDALDSTGKYCDSDAWRDFYDAGLTPEESWAEEKSYWYY